MRRELLAKYVGTPSEKWAADQLPTTESEGEDDCGSFGWLRGIRDRATCVELRSRTGAIVAIPYAVIERFMLDPSGEITLDLGRRQVRIHGQNLNAESRPGVRLFEGLARHRVSWIAEAPRSLAIESTKAQTVVQEIVQ